jgi:curved DNA-binding protein CbpA
MDEHRCFYAVLGVPPTATPAEITHAFRAKLHALHPDTRSAAADDTELGYVLAAYDVLRDPVRRAEYDRTAGRSLRPDTNSTLPSRHPRAESVGPVVVSVTHRRSPDSGRAADPPLWAGPVRRHR